MISVYLSFSSLIIPDFYGNIFLLEPAQFKASATPPPPPCRRAAGPLPNLARPVAAYTEVGIHERKILRDKVRKHASTKKKVKKQNNLDHAIVQENQVLISYLFSFYKFPPQMAHRGSLGLRETYPLKTKMFFSLRFFILPLY